MKGSDEPEERSSAGTWMQPIHATVPAFATAESARRRLQQDALRFLVVVAPGTGKLVGAVDGEALASRPCCERLRGRCTVARHLAPDVDFCFHHESAREIAEAEAERVEEVRVPAVRRIPLIVVDDDLRPLGCFSAVSTVRDSSPARAA